MKLGDYRAAVAAALEGLDDDWTVIDGPTDAVDPPCYMLQWGPDPWREPQGACFDATNLTVYVVVGRHQPAQLDLCEFMVDRAAVALLAAGLRHVLMLAPAPLDIGGHTRIVARIQLTQPVQIGD
jgi:hypothetical protein